MLPFRKQFSYLQTVPPPPQKRKKRKGGKIHRWPKAHESNHSGKQVECTLKAEKPRKVTKIANISPEWDSQPPDSEPCARPLRSRSECGVKQAHGKHSLCCSRATELGGRSPNSSIPAPGPPRRVGNLLQRWHGLGKSLQGGGVAWQGWHRTCHHETDPSKGRSCQPGAHLCWSPPELLW